jgi:hypothetical protein
MGRNRMGRNKILLKASRKAIILFIVIFSGISHF